MGHCKAPELVGERRVLYETVAVVDDSHLVVHHHANARHYVVLVNSFLVCDGHDG